MSQPAGDAGMLVVGTLAAVAFLVALSGRAGRIMSATKGGSMARDGRNDPCPCGSGRKAKRCCGVSCGPRQEQLELGFLAAEARRAARVLAGLTKSEFRDLFDDLLELPSLDLSLVLPLPALFSPELGRLLDAVADDDEEAFDECFPAAWARVDTIHARATLARAVLELRAAGRVEPRLAAVALIDLEGGGETLLRASLIQAAAIAAGVARTPGGLLVAAA